MTSAGDDEAKAVDVLLERVAGLLEDGLELIASAERHQRLEELAALTRDLAVLSAAAARLGVTGELRDPEPRSPGRA